MNPGIGDKTLLAYSYTPPSFDTCLAISEKLKPVNIAMMLDNIMDITIAGPALNDAMPIITKIPAPIMAPRFIMTALKSVMFLLSSIRVLWEIRI